MGYPANLPPLSPKRRTFPIFLAVAAFVILLAVVIFLRVGHWLVVEDPLEHARAIVVLSGGMPVRALEAAKLYRAGNAQEVWLTRPAQPGDSLQAMGIPYVGEDFYNLRILIHEGVPADAIRVLKPSIRDTADEMKVIAAALAGGEENAVIIVTTKAHTRRVRTLWRRIGSWRGRAIVRAASGDPFDPSRWWRTSSDALDVVREVLGLLNTWAGLPLQPSQ